MGVKFNPFTGNFDLTGSGGLGDYTPTKGNLLAGNGTTWITVGVGTNGQTLVAASTEPSGLDWTTPAGGGDVLKVGTPVNNQVGVWTGDGTLEGDTALTFDTTTDLLTSGTLRATTFTASEMVLTDASKNLVSAPVATYPSLTELTYLKGATSSLQTQINAKAPSTAPTFATSVTGSYLTASEVLITDASKNVVSAPVATYPSLTEFSYVKGVTSSIQTQLNAKGVGTVTSVALSTPTGLTISGSPVTTTGTFTLGLDTGYVIPLQTAIDAKANSSGSLTQFVGNTAWRVFYSDSLGDVTELALGADGTFLKSNGATSAPSFATPAGSGDVSKVGTPVNDQITVWTGNGTVEGDSALTFDTTTDKLSTVALNLSGLTASELISTDASKNLQSLAVATYPSLTELTYVKGVTSAIQTQLGTKAPTTSPTFATSVTGSYLTASEILITDASKNLVSAPVATYPSLTELTYVKGVTSAIQTQLGTKAPTTSPTFATSVTGSYLTASEILITDASKNLVSAPVATYPSLTELTYVKGVTSAIQTQLGSKQASDATLTALAAYNTNGLLTQTAADTFTGRTVTGTANEISVSNGDGVSGNPTLSLPATIDLGGKTSLEIPNSAAPTVDADGEIAVDTTVTDFSHGLIKYYSGEALAVVAMPIAQFTSPTNNYVVTYDSTADEFQLKAGGGSSWSFPFTQVQASSVSAYAYFYNDNFTSASNQGWGVDQNGTGSGNGTNYTSDFQNHPGWWYQETGTTTTGNCTIRHPGSWKVANGEVMYESVIEIGTLADATNDYYIQHGLVNDIGNSLTADGIYLIYNRGTSTSWQGVCRASGAQTAVTGSTVTATQYRLGFKVNTAASSVEFFVDGTSIGTVSANIPTGNLTIIQGIKKIAGTTSVYYGIDYTAFAKQVTR